MNQIKDAISLIRLIVELVKLIGIRRTRIALADKCRDCRAVHAEMQEFYPDNDRQYEEEKYRD